jgi:hypothetical protein
MEGQQAIDLDDPVARTHDYAVSNKALTPEGLAERAGELDAEARVRQFTMRGPYAGKLDKAWQRGFDRALRHLGLSRAAIERALVRKSDKLS